MGLKHSGYKSVLRGVRRANTKSQKYLVNQRQKEGRGRERKTKKKERKEEIRVKKEDGFGGRVQFSHKSAHHRIVNV